MEGQLSGYFIIGYYFYPGDPIGNPFDGHFFSITMAGRMADPMGHADIKVTEKTEAILRFQKTNVIKRHTVYYELECVGRSNIYKGTWKLKHFEPHEAVADGKAICRLEEFPKDLLLLALSSD